MGDRGDGGGAATLERMDDVRRCRSEEDILEGVNEDSLLVVGDGVLNCTDDGLLNETVMRQCSPKK